MFKVGQETFRYRFRTAEIKQRRWNVAISGRFTAILNQVHSFNYAPCDAYLQIRTRTMAPFHQEREDILCPKWPDFYFRHYANVQPFGSNTKGHSASLQFGSSKDAISIRSAPADQLRNSHWELFFFLCRHILVQMAEFKIGKADGIEYLKVGFEICTPSKLERRCKCIGILALSFNYLLSRTYIGPVRILHISIVKLSLYVYALTGKL